MLFNGFLVFAIDYFVLYLFTLGSFVEVGGRKRERDCKDYNILFLFDNLSDCS